MSNIGLVIEERAADIGNFMVGRLLPFRKKRAVGPFVFIDHFGPVQFNNKNRVDVPPHPHIGISTLTYLFEGAILHRDSTGAVIEIEPGDVNWMTAGRGVVHSERTPDHLKNSKQTLHGLQIWVALPRELEQMEPSFNHFEEKDIPEWEDMNVTFRLIAGNVLGRQSPVPVKSPLYFIEIKNTEPAQLNLGDQLFGDSGLYILEGAVKSEGHTFGPRRVLVANDSKLCAFEMEANSTIYLFGGEPFPEERFIHWNFVNSDRAMIEKARHDWLVHAFPEIKGDQDFVPLPQ